MTYKSHFGIDYDTLKAQCDELAATIPEDVGHALVHREPSDNGDSVEVLFWFKDKSQGAFSSSVHEFVHDEKLQPLYWRFNGHIFPLSLQFLDLFKAAVPIEHAIGGKSPRKDV